ncbi:MAG: enoyl-CoA hydratase/isomerase family protein [Geminicoccaceae bacterium]
MTSDSLRLERNGAVLTLVLNRPQRQNAIDRATWVSLARCCEELDQDPGTRAVILRGEGAAFSSGADIREFAEVFADEGAAHAYNELVQNALGRLERLTKPTIAQIHGNCIGGGCALAIACDLRFAADGAKLGITPARLGLAYSLGDVRRLAALVGPARAKDLLFSARLMGSAEAQKIGLVDHVVPGHELEAAVHDYARGIAQLSGNSHRVIKALLGLVASGQMEENAHTRALRDGAVSHPDFLEGRRAFLERRPPCFA